jgi:hypothetical protein
VGGLDPTPPALRHFVDSAGGVGSSPPRSGEEGSADGRNGVQGQKDGATGIWEEDNGNGATTVGKERSGGQSSDGGGARGRGRAMTSARYRAAVEAEEHAGEDRRALRPCDGSRSWTGAGRARALATEECADSREVKVLPIHKNACFDRRRTRRFHGNARRRFTRAGGQSRATI